MRTKLRNAAAIASRQHGAITTAQLLEAGFSRWHANGLLHTEFRGVWRFGHRAPSYEARYMAVVLAGGLRAPLSGRAALFHYGLLRGDPPGPEVSAPKEHDVPGIVARRRTIPSRIWRGIPTAIVPQVIADVAASLSLDDLARICHQAEILYGVDRVATPGRPGAAKLRAIYQGDHHLLLSRVERAFLALLGPAACRCPSPTAGSRPTTSTAGGPTIA
jgi:hypothetical protein